MSYKITDNTAGFENATRQKASIFLRVMTDLIHDFAYPNTPKDTGNLRRNVLKQVLALKAKIEWRSNYAIFQETKRYQNYSTPGTGPHFAEDSVNKGVGRTASVARQVGLI